MSEDITDGVVSHGSRRPQFAVVFIIDGKCDRVLADDGEAAEMWQSKIIAASHGKATVRIDPLGHAA